MAELQESSKIDMQTNYSVGNNSDPKNMQELTQYVSENIFSYYYLNHDFIL